jgi:hypothetical protein
MTTYTNAFKRTIHNWIKENKTLAYTLIGAISLPLLLGIGFGSISLIIWLLSLVFGLTLAIVITLLALIGGFAGWLLSGSNEEEDDEY